MIMLRLGVPPATGADAQASSNSSVAASTSS